MAILGEKIVVKNFNIFCFYFFVVVGLSGKLSDWSSHNDQVIRVVEKLILDLFVLD
ncbi:hypothetical protein LEP1GSC008_1869 [Leptospira kirschneri serovar Bulgarica str. Nikolaevo]|uniref:Uncharacterized protein n=2 Tax=Leptospira kirschneri TaxID=29507 RepID=A0A0E2AXH7_9LEPT|nr:hypothetical protein LEP1GSC081_0156 [Leptospira kirschneri str. H1]EMK25365.1 hypothetical protein LEP1GSC008_1869 [Leptospira kirschneri serovar Bulgarica str. Nikolaevo]